MDKPTTPPRVKRPLRLVVDWFADEKTGALKERLECGHIIGKKQDAFGYTSASRRRCRHCPEER